MITATATLQSVISVTAQIVSKEIGNCADATVQLNGSTIGTIASGDTDSFPVTQDGLPVGSWNGSAWIIPPESCPSVVLAISDNNPDVNEQITLTATPSNITPDTYIFYAINSNDDIELIYQGASNSVNWTVDISIGEWTIFVDVVESDTIHASDCEAIEVFFAYDPDLEAYLTAVGIQNNTTVYNATYGITGEDIWNNLNDFYLALKSESGLYEAGHWMYLYIGNDANIAKINLFDPRDLDAAFRVDWNGGWIFNDNGRISNGTNTYGDTHFNPSTELAVNDGAYFVYKRTQPSGVTNAYEWGAFDGSNFDGLSTKATSNRSFYGVGVIEQVNGISTSVLDGFQCISRDNDANQQVWIRDDGTIVNVDTTSFVGHPNYNEFVGARNDSGSADLFLQNLARVSMEGRFDGLSSSQYTALRNAVKDLMTDFGWNV